MKSYSLPKVTQSAAFLTLLISSLWALWAAIGGMLQVMPYNLPLNYGDGPILDQVRRLSHFGSMYQPDLNTYPWTISNYPPLYMVLQVPLVWLWGLDFRIGRVLSLCAVVGSSWTIFRIVLLLTQNKTSALVAAVIFFSLPLVVVWGPLGRVDSVAILFGLQAIYAALKAYEGKTRFLKSGLWMIAAIFTRQTALLFSPLVVFFWLLFKGQIGQACRLLVSVLLVVVVIGGLLNFLSSGGFWLHTVTANINPISLDRLLSLLLLLLHWCPLLIAYSLALLFFRFLRVKAPYQLLFPLLGFGFVTSLLIAKEGSDLNYFFDFGAAISICSGVFLAQSTARSWIFSSMGAALLAAQIFYQTQISRVQGFGPSPHYIAALHEALEKVRQASGPVLADDAMGLELLSGKELSYQPFERRQLAQAGLWNQAPLLEMIRHKKFDFIMVNEENRDLFEQRWTEEARLELSFSYKRAQQLEPISIYVPR